MNLNPIRTHRLIVTHPKMPPPGGVPPMLAGPGEVTHFDQRRMLMITADYLTDPVHNDTYPAIDPTKASLAGKSVFISGASKGIGRAMSLSFAKAGASQIAIAARSDMVTLEQEIQDAASSAGKPSPAVLQVKLDVASRESVDGAASVVEKEFGKLDILVNNAGISSSFQSIADSDPDGWWNTWIVNFRGPYLMTRAFLPLLLKAEDKHIVNVSSVGAHLMIPCMSSYQTSKSALLRFTEFISAEYSDKGLVAFCIHPGNILTDMVTSPESPVPDEVKYSM